MNKSSSRRAACFRTRALPLLAAIFFFGCATQPSAPLSISAARCRANLKQIQSIKHQWAAAEQKRPEDLITRDDIMRIDRYLLNAFECEEGGTYIWGRVGEPATCSVTGHNPK